MSLEPTRGRIWKGPSGKLKFRVVRHDQSTTEFRALAESDDYYQYSVHLVREPGVTGEDWHFYVRKTIHGQPNDVQEFGRHLISGNSTYNIRGKFAEYGPTAKEILFPKEPRLDFLGHLVRMAHKQNQFQLDPASEEHRSAWEEGIGHLWRRYRLPPK